MLPPETWRYHDECGNKVTMSKKTTHQFAHNNKFPPKRISFYGAIVKFND